MFIISIINYLARGLFFYLLFINIANASNLDVKLNDLPKEVKKNIHSYLGKLPETELERSTFIYSAKENVNKALEALGYYQAELRATVEKEPWQLLLTVNLPDPTLLDKVNIIIDGGAKDDPVFISLLNNNGLLPGSVLNHGKYEVLKSDLLSLGLQRGYFDGSLSTSVIAIKDNYQFADITLHYNSGPRYKFGEVTFNDFPLQKDLLLSLLPFHQGDYYNMEQFYQLQNNLQSTQYFGNVKTVPGNIIDDGEDIKYNVPINVTLTPAKSHQFDLGVGYATDTQLRVSVGWRTPLINRHGHYQETKFEYSQVNPTGKFIYRIPLDHPTNDVIQLKLTAEAKDYADLSTQFYSAQVGKIASSDKWNREAYLRYHREAWAYNLNQESPNIIWSEKDYAQYYIPGITWSKTLREGSSLDPSAGFRQTYNIETAHLDMGSDNSFFRVHGRWNFIKTLQPQHRLVTRAELGAIYIDRDAQLAPSLRFYAGGDQSIRGFSYQSIGSTIPSSSDPGTAVPIVVGGTRLVVGSIEYQYYINNNWRLALFTDGGSVANVDEFEPVYSFGSGIHYISPVGAVKFDFAYGIDDEKKGWHMHINLGAEL